MNYFVTTSIPYVNGEPHIGHALEFIMADVLARNARKEGKPVIFSTGTDEHGGKIADKAAEAGLKPEEFAANMSQNFRDLAKALNISNDRFIRTTDKGHEQRAQIIWKALESDIYKHAYSGLYCTGCEAFVTEATAKENNNICPDHDKAYEKIEEENYFFKLSKYAPQIAEAINDKSFQIIPASRKNEIESVIKSGLEDISISRPKEKIGWGVPVPNDKTQVMYVWFEALMNYITVLGYPEHEDFKAYWPANVQVIGKDILRFHAAIWPGMLLALGLPLPEKLFVHGFINIEGKKMSKSLGNYVTPKQILDQYNTDVFRYFFLRHIPSYDDGDFSWDRLHEVYNNELANELGNAVQRTTAMINRYQDGVIGDTPQTEHDTATYREAIEQCHFDRALEEVWNQVRGLNQYIDEQKPWVIAKEGDKEHLREVLSYQAGALLQIADLLEPFMPQTSSKIKAVFEKGVVEPIEGTLFPRRDSAPEGLAEQKGA
ncbi:MAG: methionine--tRNA ligase [Candidatus Saccharibacteria bacterium]|nr:methionine--tRNA ligase [Candidatus Saccharibacteria bacterium]